MAEQPLILIIEDEADFREIFGAQLRSEGFRIETAENGQLGIEKAKQVKPDLILLDVKMPVMDGPTALLKMREDADLKNMKVVFLTSLGDPHLEVREISEKFSKDFGAQGYIKKTDDLSTLGTKIRGYLQ